MISKTTLKYSKISFFVKVNCTIKYKLKNNRRYWYYHYFNNLRDTLRRPFLQKKILELLTYPNQQKSYYEGFRFDELKDQLHSILNVSISYQQLIQVVMELFKLNILTPITEDIEPKWEFTLEDFNDMPIPYSSNGLYGTEYIGTDGKIYNDDIQYLQNYINQIKENRPNKKEAKKIRWSTIYFHSRIPLASLYYIAKNQKLMFTATVIKISNTNGKSTVLLRNIVYNTDLVAHHLWVTVNNGNNIINFKAGARISFKANLNKYWKKVHSGLPLLNYSLKNLTNIKPLQK